MAFANMQLNESLTACLDAHAKRYANPQVRMDEAGLFDLISLGFAQIAVRCGMHIAVKNVYLPWN